MSKVAKNKNAAVHVGSAMKGLNEAIKTRKRGRLFFKILMVILGLAGVGGGVAIYFIVGNKPKIEGVDVYVEVYMLNRTTHIATYKNSYRFYEDDSEVTYGADDEMYAELNAENEYVDVCYAIINESGRSYNYVLTFENLKKDGFGVDYYVDTESSLQPLPEDGKIELQKGVNFFVAVRIKLLNTAYSVECSGYITMNISVV